MVTSVKELRIEYGGHCSSSTYNNDYIIIVVGSTGIKGTNRGQQMSDMWNIKKVISRSMLRL